MSAAVLQFSSHYCSAHNELEANVLHRPQHHFVCVCSQEVANDTCGLECFQTQFTLFHHDMLPCPMQTVPYFGEMSIKFVYLHFSKSHLPDLPVLLYVTKKHVIPRKKKLICVIFIFLPIDKII